MEENIYKEYKSIKEDIQKLDELEDNIKRLRRNLKEIAGPKGLCASEKEYVEKDETLKKRIKNMKESHYNTIKRRRLCIFSIARE